jgi:hypothetical protein
VIGSEFVADDEFAPIAGSVFDAALAAATAARSGSALMLA